MWVTRSSSSYGLLTITPRDAQGNPIETKDLVNYTLSDENGAKIKEWYAISAYLDQMDENMDVRYEQVDGRKVVYSSWNPVNLLRNANKFTYILVAAVLLLILIPVVIVRGVIRCRKRKANHGN